MSEQFEPQRAPVKVYRTPDRVTVAAPMPGIEPEDILVQVTTDQRLILDGELRGTFKGDKDVLLDEWQAGGYHRELDLPTAVDGELANLTYGNGVLVVVLPVADQLRPASLSLTTVAFTRGERVGSAGRPVQPRTTLEHLEAVHTRRTP